MITLTDSRNKYLCTGTVIKLHGMFYIVLGVEFEDVYSYDAMLRSFVTTCGTKTLVTKADWLKAVKNKISYYIVYPLNDEKKQTALDALDNFQIEKLDKVVPNVYTTVKCLTKDDMKAFLLKLHVCQYFNETKFSTFYMVEHLNEFYDRTVLQESTVLQKYVRKDFSGFDKGSLAVIKINKFQVRLYICVGKKNDDLYFVRNNIFSLELFDSLKDTMKYSSYEVLISYKNKKIVKKSKNMIPLNFKIGLK